MSIRHALLALLSEGPKYGLQLRQEFEARTGEVWPLNVGQVYTTLQRLERDELVESDVDDDDGPQKAYRITKAGRRELLDWLRDSSRRHIATERRIGDQGARGAHGPEGRRAGDRAVAPPAPHRADAAVHLAQGGQRRGRPPSRARRRRRDLPARGDDPMAGRRRGPPPSVPAADEAPQPTRAPAVNAARRRARTAR